MPPKQTVKNGSFEKDENRVLVGEDGVVRVELADKMKEEDVEQLIERIEDIMEKAPGRARILFNLSSTTTHIRSSQFRKKIAERIKEIAKNVGFAKIAFFGGNLIIRTIASFIVVSAGLKNIKIFPEQEEALKWLRKA